MICKRCGKEVDERVQFCPYCGDSMSQKESSAVNNGAKEMEYKRNAKRLKQAKKKYKKLKNYRLKVNTFTLVVIVGLIFCGILGGKFFYDTEHAQYLSEINKIAQEKRDDYAKFESGFLNTVVQNRENQIRSCLVSPENAVDASEYIASLYRHPEDEITELSLKEKLYYLITDILGLDKYSLLDSTNNAIYPGAIIRGDSLFAGVDYTVLATERTPIDIMSNQQNGAPKTISDPNYSNVTLALNQYAEAYTGDISKEWVYDLQSASTSDELNIKLGIGIGKAANLDFGFKTSEEKSTVAVVFTQIYYTVSAEPKTNAADYFKEGVDLNVLGAYEPAYVSSVDYGRKIIMVVSGELSEQELTAKLNAHIKGVQIGAAIGNIKTDESLNSKIISYGGADMLSVLSSADKDKGLIRELNEWLWGDDSKGIADRLNDFLASDASLINPVPLSYRLKYLSDNAPVPAMYIKGEDIALAENTQLVVLSAPKEIEVDITALPAILLNKNEVSQQGTKVKGKYIQLLCNDCETLPVRILYGKKEYSVDLAEYEMEKDTPIQAEKEYFMLIPELGNYYIDIGRIYKTKYLEN